MTVDRRGEQSYSLTVLVSAGIKAITLGNQALTRHCDTGAFFLLAIPSMAGRARHLNRWSVPDSDCDNRARPATILLSPDVGGLQSQSGVRIMAISQSSALPNTENTKRCTKCGKEKPLSGFCKDSTRKNGLQRCCKDCNAAYCKNWKITNQDHWKTIVRNYCNNNKDVLRERNAKYRVTDDGKLSKKKWKLANQQAVTTHHRNRKARKRNAEGSHTAADIQQLLILQKSKCAVCRVSIAKGYHVDHVIPLALNGGNGKDNLQLLCPHCNLSKNAQHPVDFMQSRGMLL